MDRSFEKRCLALDECWMRICPVVPGLRDVVKAQEALQCLISKSTLRANKTADRFLMLLGREWFSGVSPTVPLTSNPRIPTTIDSI